MTALLYDIICIFPVLLLAVVSAAPFIGLPEENVTYYPLAALLAICCFCIKHLKGRYKAVLPGITLALGMGVIVLKEAEERAAFIQENIWVLWCLGIVAAAFLLGMLIAYDLKVRLISSAAVFGLLIYFMVAGPQPDRVQTAPALFLILLSVIDVIQRYWKKSGYTDTKGHLISVSPFALLLALIVFLIPASEKPYDWNIVKTVAGRIYDGIKYTARFFHGKDEDYGSVMGFSDSGPGFGNLFEGEKELMKINTDRQTGPGIYLAGRVLDDFNGREWNRTYDEDHEDRLMDSLETVSSIMQYDEDYNFDYYKRVQLYITYNEFNTAYFLAPSKMLELVPENEKEAYIQHGFEMCGERKLGYGTKYLLTYIRTNERNEGFTTYADGKSLPIEKDIWDQVCYAFHYDKTPGCSYDDYMAYTERMFQYYLPQTEISERAEAYMEELFDGAEGDMEKLKLIEEALSGFEYTLTPGDLPEEIDNEAEFLDRLLFETGEGYCTYYATAFVIMARSIGIPARFVQGFRVPMNSSQSVSVMSSMAHAWPEAYIKGVGWIAFEPTPRMAFDSAWQFMNRESTTAFEDRSHFDEGKDGEQQEDIAEPEEEKKAVDLRVIFIPLGLIVLFLLVFVLLDRMIQSSRYNKMDTQQKLLVNCRYGIRLLRSMGIRISQGETLQEFALRAYNELYEAGEENNTEADPYEGTCLGFVERYEQLLYSDKKAGEEALPEVMEDISGLFGLIRIRKGRIRTLIIKLGGMRI